MLLLRGDGNPPEVPVIRTVLRAYNGVWGVPIKHMSAALCAHKCRACRTTLPNDFAKQSIVSLYPGGRTYKDGLRPSVSAPFPTSEDLYLDSEKGMMVFSRGAAPLFLGVEHRGQYEPPQRTEKADVGSRTRQVVLTEPLRFRLGHPMDHSNAVGSPRRFVSLRCEPLTLSHVH